MVVNLDVALECSKGERKNWRLGDGLGTGARAAGMKRRG